MQGPNPPTDSSISGPGFFIPGGDRPFEREDLAQGRGRYIPVVIVDLMFQLVLKMPPCGTPVGPDRPRADQVFMIYALEILYYQLALLQLSENPTPLDQ